MVGVTTPPERPLRVDAQRNRERILRAAREVLLEVGLDAPVDDIAGRADVGVGTIYRRFGDRDGLVRAVTLDIVEMLAARAEEATRSGLSPETAFRHFVVAVFEIRLGVLASLLLPVMSTVLADDEEFLGHRHRLLTAAEKLIARAQQAGALRRDVGVADVLLTIGRISRPLPGMPAEFEAAQAERAAVLLLDGLVTGTPTEIGGPPHTRAELDRVLRDAGKRTEGSK
jgi:AcrR family transcriptional regulator